MESTVKIITSLFLIAFFLRAISGAKVCPTAACRSTEPIIRFPFRLDGVQAAACGYPGFTLSCDASNQTLLDLPNNSGSFVVNSIDYARQFVWLNDLGNCLPRRLLELNLSGSPFHGAFLQDFTFYQCPDSDDYRRLGYNPIACLSGDNYTVFATSKKETALILAPNCTRMAMVAVPVQVDFLEAMVTADLSEDVRLAWRMPPCRRCERQGGLCGLKSQNSSAVECRNAGGRKLPRLARYAVIVGVSVPGFLCLLGLICCLGRRVGRCCGWQRHQPAVMDFSVMVVPQPDTTRSGLDGDTIESYPKTVLGESRRLPNPEDNICSICLSEYVAKDALRTIPDCHHSFHADCIDEWLQQNPSCPVCRNSPKPSTPTQAV